jgi:lipid II:glycine glycyltransferase (peptidoglycan interpeptide bridge formation enzyme)
MTTLRQCTNSSDWDDYVLEHGGHPLQLWGWGEVKSAHGWSACRLYLYNDDQTVTGAVQVLFRKLPWPLKSMAYVPRGPVVDMGDREELLQSLSDYIKQRYGSVVLMIEPDEIEYDITHGWEKSDNHILPARTIILDLTKSEDDLLSDMAKKTRQYIRKSAGEAVIKQVSGRTELNKCLDMYHATAERAKFDLHGDQYYHDVFDKLGDNCQVFAAYSDGQPVAFLWLAISADTAFELYGGMNEVGQRLRSNYALKWHAIRKCQEWGLTRYDFGGLIEGGVSTFKLGWASQETELIGTFVRPLSPFYSVWNSGLPLAKTIVRRIKSIFKLILS